MNRKMFDKTIKQNGILILQNRSKEFEIAYNSSNGSYSAKINGIPFYAVCDRRTAWLFYKAQQD